LKLALRDQRRGGRVQGAAHRKSLKVEAIPFVRLSVVHQDATELRQKIGELERLPAAAFGYGDGTSLVRLRVIEEAQLPLGACHRVQRSPDAVAHGSDLPFDDRERARQEHQPSAWLAAQVEALAGRGHRERHVSVLGSEDSLSFEVGVLVGKGCLEVSVLSS
jgi:hypothetical protein